jgi:hypothetical protein
MDLLVRLSKMARFAARYSTSGKTLKQALGRPSVLAAGGGLGLAGGMVAAKNLPQQQAFMTSGVAHSGRVSSTGQSIPEVYVLDMGTNKLEQLMELFNGWYRRIEAYNGQAENVPPLCTANKPQVRRNLLGSAATVLHAILNCGGGELVLHTFEDERTVVVIWRGHDLQDGPVYQAMTQLDFCDILDLRTSERIAAHHGLLKLGDLEELIRVRATETT